MADTLPRFGANDFYLTETDPVVIREKLRAALADILGREVVDADPHMVLASAFMPFLVQGLASIDACAKATLRAYAVGADLDRIADSTCVVGYLNRKPARGAILPVIIQCDIARDSDLAASDVLIRWADSLVVGMLPEDLNFIGSGEFVMHYPLTAGLSKHAAFPGYLICDKTGPVGNALFADPGSIVEDEALTASAVVTAIEAPSTATGQSFTVSGVSVSIAGESYGGSDIEDDASFSERVAWQAKALRVPGSLEYFKLALSGVSLLPSAYVAPSLDAYGRIVMAWADKAHWLSESAGLTLSDKGSAYNEFLSIVQGSLLVEQRVYAYKAQPVSLDARFTASYYLPAGTADIASAQSRVEAAFKAWRSSVAWRCGAVVRWADAAAALSSAGASNVSFLTTTVGDGALPADRFLLASQITLVYAGLSEDATPAAGGSGEDITPV